MKHAWYYRFPVGKVCIGQDGEHITFITYGCSQTFGEGYTPRETPLLAFAARQLDEYFCGKRRTFSLPIAPKGTAFQQQVWEALQQIPYGQTRTYQQIAEVIGAPAACRAVGNANNKNPISIVIPCHRVIGANGKLTGYAGGLDAKARLLELEQQP